MLVPAKINRNDEESWISSCNVSGNELTNKKRKSEEYFEDELQCSYFSI